jgi:hypothetical protein
MKALTTAKKLSHLPLEKFMAVALAGHRQPDPMPLELVAAAAILVLTALATL